MDMITEKDVINYYDEIYGKKGVNAMRPFSYYQQVFGYFGSTRVGKKVLDVGCGTGYILKSAVSAGLKAYGLDISGESVEISKNNVPEADITAGSGENLPYQNSFFDYVVCGGSLEHFLDMDKGMNEMVRVAKPEAKFMITVPNSNYFLWKFRGEYGTKQKDLKETLMSYDEWKKFFKEHGLKVINIYHDPWPWQSVKIFKHKNPWRIVRRAFYRFIWLFMPLKYTYQFIFILNKKR